MLVSAKVKLVTILHWLQSDPQPFFLEPHPIFLVPVDSDDYLLENLVIPPAEVVLEEGVAVWIIPVELDLFVRQLDYPGSLFQIYGLLIASHTVLPRDFEVALANLYDFALQRQNNGCNGFLFVQNLDDPHVVMGKFIEGSAQGPSFLE